MKTPEELLARLINHLAEKYKNQLVLKGGMLLRLLNSPRATQDLDYAWIRTKKRTLFAEELKESLEKLEGVRVTDVLANSRGIFLTVLDQTTQQKAKIEISVVKSLNQPPKPMTTARLVAPFSLAAKVVSTMDLAEAFSNKIAASLERSLARDLYDLVQFEPLTPFDAKTLQDRLSELEVGRNKPKKTSLPEAVQILQEKADSLTDKKIRDELSATVPQEQLVGMEMIIRATVVRIIQKMKLMGAP